MARALPTFGPEPLYRVGRWFLVRGNRRLAYACKMLNAVLFRAFVPPEMEAGQRLTFNHFGMGVVIHPSTTLGDDVLLNHNVTLATRVAIDSLERLRIGDRVSIGAGAIVIGAIEVGADAVIGAGAVVTKSVPARAVVVGNPARVLKMLDAES